MIGKLTLGKTYIICDLGVDSYQSNTTAKIVSSTSIREVDAPSDEFLKNKQNKIEQQQKSLPKISAKLEKLSIDESTIMFQIKKTVEKNISQYEILPNQGMIWQMTEKIFDRYGIAN